MLGELEKGKKYLSMARVLTALQDEAFLILGLAFPYFDGKRLAMKEIEHTLCEYAKYKCSRGMKKYHSGVSLDADVDCFLCSRKNPDEGYYCELCDLFHCSHCIKSANGHSNYEGQSFVCLPCRQIELIARTDKRKEDNLALSVNSF